jgi:two-component system sensor histidine kinase KdpD
VAPGVGKTYQMLTAGRRRRGEGVDVVVGVVETLGRKETEALTEGLEVMARQPIECRGRQQIEFELDGALPRRPGLLLVDEYARSNAHGSRHLTRWQDVEELLAAGIDVWTTLNVQHLESLVDVVWKITGVRVRETAPDEIELLDLTPQDLRERLSAWKVYVPETARLASYNVFKSENLTALREMALRRQGVEDPGPPARGPWCWSRAMRRLADLMDAPWAMTHVERPNRPARSVQPTRRVTEALKLAEQLGAASLMLTGDDLPDAVLAYARRNNVTQIVIGKPKDSFRRVLAGRSLAHALMRRSGGAALHFVSDGAPEAETSSRSSRRGVCRSADGVAISARWVWWRWPMSRPSRSTRSPPVQTWR